MKRYIPVFLMLLMVTGCCMGTIIPEVKQEGWKVGGIYLLHDNPKAGDFAEYRIIGRTVVGGTVEVNCYWEGKKIVDIYSVNNGTILVREYYTTDRVVKEGGSSLMQVSPSPPITRYITMKPDGRITGINDNGVKKQIALKGENGYMEYNDLGKSTVAEVDAGKFTVRPAYSRAKRGYSVKSLFVNQNNIYDEISIKYVSDRAMFRTVMEQMLISGKMNTAVRTSEMAQMVFTSLTFTPFFTNPASLITGPAKGNLKEYITGSVVPGKKEAAEKVTRNLLDITVNSPFSNSGVAYLVKQGNRYSRN